MVKADAWVIKPRGQARASLLARNVFDATTDGIRGGRISPGLAKITRFAVGFNALRDNS